MGKFIALTAVVLAFLVVPALASAAPTASQITTPSATKYVVVDEQHASVFHVAGTTSGGTGNVDLVCYGGGKTPVIAGNVPVTSGAFSTDVQIDSSFFPKLAGSAPFCMLRAVPTGTLPPGAPDQPSMWSGVFVGFGYAGDRLVGPGYDPTPADAAYDYVVGLAQSHAYNDYYSSSGCGLCDTWLFVPGSLGVSNAIWWSNASIGPSTQGSAPRAYVRIDGADAYTARTAYNQGVSHLLVDNRGFPAVTKTYQVDQNSGNLTIREDAPYTWCAEDRSAFPPTGTSCSTFADTGVHFERDIEQTHSGQMVTIVDHWKSVDGKAHDLDAIYDDQAWSQNSASAGHEGRLNFNWTPDGFTKSYAKNTQMPLPASVPASVFVKTDGTLGVGGDNKNPWGAMTYGSMPSEVKVVQMSDSTSKVNDWQSRYQQTIPAGGEITVAMAYSADFALPAVDVLADSASVAVTPPSVHVDAPADGSTVDAPSVHVSGTASSKDGEVSVSVNGTHVATDPNTGAWGADVPLSEGDNQIIVSAQNDIGVVANQILHVTRPAAPVAPATPATPSTTPVVAPTSLRCVVPKLRGKTVTKAKGLLKKAHCRLGKVSRKVSKNVKPGRIVATRFKVGTRHPVGARVRVTIAMARRN